MRRTTASISAPWSSTSSTCKPPGAVVLDAHDDATLRAHLADSLKRAGRRLRLLAPMILVEAGEHPIEVVRGLRTGQPVDRGAGVAHWASIRGTSGSP